MNEKTNELNKEKLDKDYIDRKNSFSNWILGGVSATFLFLCSKKDPASHSTIDFLANHWKCYLVLFFITIFAIFSFKFFGIYTSKCRLDSGTNQMERLIEDVRTGLFFTFLIVAILQFCF